MSGFRGCLMLIGLMMLGFVGSCVLGITNANRIANPTQFSRTVDAAPDDVRRALTGFLDVAENEGPADRGLGNVRNNLFVGDYDDGTLRMTLDGDTRQLMQVVVTLKPGGEEGTTEVEVFSDADGLADAIRPRVRPAALHRAIRAQIADALSAIDRHTLVGGGFLISDVIEDARGASRGRVKRID